MTGLPRSRLQLVGVDESGGFSSAYQHALQRRGVLLPMADSFDQLRRQAIREFWPSDDDAEEGGAPGKDGSARMADGPLAVDAPSSSSGSGSGSVPPSHVIRIFLQEGVTPGVDRYSGVSWGGEVTAANFQLLRDNDRLEVVRMRAPTPAPAAAPRAQSGRHTSAAVGMNGHGKRKRDDTPPMARVPASSTPAAGARQPLSSAAATAATSMPSTPPRSAAPAVALVDSPMPPLENARGEVQSQAGPSPSLAAGATSLAQPSLADRYLVSTAMPPTRPTSTNFSASGASTGALAALPPPIAHFAHQAAADGPNASAHLASALPAALTFAFQQHQMQLQMAQRQADQQQQQQQQQLAARPQLQAQQQQQQQANHAAQVQLEHARVVQHMQHQQQLHQQQMVAEIQQNLVNETVIHQMLGSVLHHQISPGHFPTAYPAAGMQQQQPPTLFQQQLPPPPSTTSSSFGAPPPPPTRLIGVNRRQPTHQQQHQPRQQQQPPQQQRQAQSMRTTQPAPSFTTSAPSPVPAVRSTEPTPLPPPPPPATATAAGTPGAAPAISPPAPATATAPRPVTPPAVDSTPVAPAPATTSDVDAFIMIHFIRFVAPAAGAGTSADSSSTAAQLEPAPLVSIRMKRKKQIAKGFKAFCGYLQADPDEYRFYRASRTGLTPDQLKADPALYDTRIEGTDTPHALGWQEEQFVLAKQSSA